jgi:hypothetical protein
MAESIETRLKRRFNRFLNGSRARSLRQGEPIRKSALEVLRRTTSRQWRTYIVGGAIRDLLLGPAGTWPRDVDVIVDGCTADDLKAVFGDILVRRTSFGGLHLRKTVDIHGLTTANYDLLFDVWRLEDTWAIKKSGLDPTIASFLRTPFLNIDSIAVDFANERGPTAIHENGFFQALATRTLEINSEPNPFPVVCAVRSLILAAKLNFWIGPRLAQFIQDLMNTASISDLLSAQISHYGRIRCNEDDIAEWLAHLIAQLHAGHGRVRLVKSPEQQLRLWQDWPPHSDTDESRRALTASSTISRSE